VSARAAACGDRLVPNAIFSHPEVASFGTSEEPAQAQDLPIVVAQVCFNGNSKAVIEGRLGLSHVVLTSVRSSYHAAASFAELAGGELGGGHRA
jgi:pyruvate/2-oxoglutarate dehydrogenase complex dihydrolipoamide dehydrogenase (E3) component